MPLTTEEKLQCQKELNDLLPSIEGYKVIYNFFAPPTKIGCDKNVNTIHDDSLKAALHYVAELGELTRIKKLLQDGADINLKGGKKRNTALMFALLSDNDEMAAYLIEQGADINLGNSNGATPLHIAMSRGKLDIAKLLVNRGANFCQQDFLHHYTPIAAAIVAGQHECVQYVLASIDLMNQRDLFNKTLLHLAIEFNQPAIALALIKHPVGSQMKISKDIYGQTPLAMAMAKSMDEVINALSGLPKVDFSQDPRYGKKLIIINQAVLLEKFNQYLQLAGRNTEYLTREGMCNGLSFIAGCYAAESQIKEFYEILSKIAQCDFEKMPLHDPQWVASMPKNYKGESYTDLDALFNSFLNDITWHQHDQLEKETGISQAERQKQFEISSNKKILEEFGVAFKATKSQLTSILAYLADKSGSVILFSGGQHTTQAFVLPHNEFTYYDTTFETRAIDFDATHLSDVIQKIKYKFFNACVKGEYDSNFCENMELYIAAYRIVNKPTSLVYSDLYQDEIFFMRLLKETSAFVINGKINPKLLEESLAIACQAHSPQSVRTLLRYGKHDECFMEMAFTRSISCLSSACLLATLEEGYRVTDKTLGGASLIFKSYIVKPSEMDKKRYDLLLGIISYYHRHPWQAKKRHSIYDQSIAAIEKNSPEHLSKILQDHKITEDDWHDLVKRAIFLEKKACLELLLNFSQFTLTPDLTEIASELDLINISSKLKM